VLTKKQSIHTFTNLEIGCFHPTNRGKKMNVLVTGGAGYLGSTLCRQLLERGHKVTCLDRLFFGTQPLQDISDKIKILKDDIRWFNPQILEGIDAVLDLASICNDPNKELDSQKTLEINHKGRVRVATLAKKHGTKKYVLASTCSVYGYQDGMLNEKSPLNPQTTYAKASLKAEKEILPLADKTFSPTVLRPTTLYGKSLKMRFDLTIHKMVLGFSRNGQIPILRDGKQWHPYVHIKDTSNAFTTIIESTPELVSGQIFNVGANSQNIQAFNLAQTIAKAIKLPFKYEWYGSKDTRSYQVNFNKIKKTLNYKTNYTIKDGAKQVYEAIQKGTINADDPCTIPVKWYKKLLQTPSLRKEVEINGIVL